MGLVKIVGVGALLSSAALPSIAWAQASDAEAGNANEIIVTALRREQRLQDVPAAISVLSGEDLQAKAQYDLRDYLTTVPGVNFGENNVGGMRVAIRGISDGISSGDPLTGIYIDEAPVTESTAGTLDPDIYDVERVEVLKGPQGTLYGSGSMGGTVRIITKKPRLDRFEGSVEGSISDITGGGTMYKVDGVLNAPIIEDKLALRVSGGYRKDGGWIDDLPRDKDDANWIEKKNLRGQLLFKPGEDTTVVAGILYQKGDSGLPPFDDLTASYQGTALQDYQSAKIYRQSRESEATLASLTINQAWGGVALTSASNYLKKTNQATFDLTPGQSRVIRAITGITLGPLEGLGLNAPTKTSQFTQEVRLASTGQQTLGWLIGGFYSDVSTDTTEQFDFSQAPSLTGVLTSDQYYLNLRTIDTRQIAGFGELTFNVNDKFSVTGGLRVFNVRQHVVTNTSGILNGGTTSGNLSSEFTSSTKKALVQYKIDGDHMVYAQAAQGYRNGAPNSPIPLSTCGQDLLDNGYTTAPSAYGPDRLWNYELGSKNTFLGGRVQLNASAFLIKWSKIQNTVALQCGLGFVDNAGEAESKGFEFEGTVRPVEGLTLTGSVSYADAKLTDVAQGTAGAVGDPLPLVAKLSANGSVAYEQPIGDDLSIFARGEVNYVGDRWNTFRSITARAVKMSEYATVGARVGVQGENWSVAVFGTNLTDRRYVLYVNPRNYENVGRPRTIGVNARFGF